MSDSCSGLGYSRLLSSLISKEDFYSAKSEQIVEDSYEGSLPAFIAAFTSHKKLSKKEVDEIQRMIDAIKKEG
ncbi:MAG: BlaI/MecI/CopY family transcriptional regulator [Lachnospiraceae bacterium]|nr:BlaI/MecI/CopY family transcriptional regulator [Lachnospiraceae bacterium]